MKGSGGTGWRLLATAWLGAGLALASDGALAQTVNDAYAPSVNGDVWAILPQPDGALLIGGDFTEVNGVARGRIARLLPDGSVDPSFTINLPNGMIYDMALDHQGRILLVGSFTQVGASQRNRIARLLPDGTLDPGFNPGSNDDVLAVLVLPDDRILIGGSFSTIAGTAGQSNLARLLPSGALDSSFVGSASSAVWALARQPDGRLLIGGSFSLLNGQDQARVGRLHGDGSLDSSFNPTISGGSVLALALDPDGRIWIAGNFSTVNSTSRPFLARLTATGDLNSPSYSQINGIVWALKVRGDGALALAGRFNPNPTNYCLVQLLSIDGSFSCRSAISLIAGTPAWASALAEQPDGKLVAGAITQIGGSRGLLRFGPELWDLGQSANATSNSFVVTAAVDAQSRVWVGGNYTAISGIDRPRLNRVDHFADLSFPAPAPDALVHSIALQRNGQVLVGGDFQQISAATRPHLARLNESGSLDPDFNPQLNLTVFAITPQADGRITIGGEFSLVNGSARAHIARLNADGTLDGGFSAGTDGPVYRMVSQPDGRLIISGNFESVNATPRPGIARLNGDGSLDSGFAPSERHHAIAVDVQGRILAASNTQNILRRFQANGSPDPSFGPVSVNGVNQILVQADGRIVIGGYFTEVAGQPRLRLARLLPDGALDTSFIADVLKDGDPEVFAQVMALAALPDGRLWVGGDFDSIGGVARQNLARLKLRDGASDQLTIDGQTVRWRRTGPGHQPALPPELEFSTDGSAFLSVGTMHWVNDEWRYSGFQPPLNQTFYLRTSGPLDHGSSTGLVRSKLRKFFIRPDLLFADRFD